MAPGAVCLCRLWPYPGARRLVVTAAQNYADYRADYTYDGETDRIEKVAGDVVTTDGVQYTYDSYLIKKIEYKDGANTKARVVYAYDPDADLPTEVKNKWPNAQDPNDPNTIVSRYEYDYDNLWRAKWVVRESRYWDLAFANNHHDKFTSYSDRNELTVSDRFRGTDPDNPGSADDAYDRRYWYDTAGNTIKHKRGTGPETAATYSALNLRTSVGDPNDPDAEFTYDDDHNLTLDTADRAKLGIATR